jgi:Ca2+/Na+ antiporter
MYDPSSPNRIYFSIGEAIATIAIIIVILQLIDPIKKFRIEVSRTRIRVFYIIFFIAIVSVLFSATLPFIPGEALPFIGYPVFWEVLSGIAIMGVVIYLLYRIHKPVKISRKNYKQFFAGCRRILYKGKEGDLTDFADEIYFSIDEIVKEAKRYDRYDAYFANKEGKKYEISEYTRHVLVILDMLSDEQFCRVMVCYSPQTVIKLFKEIVAHKLFKSGGHFLVQQLVEQAFNNKNSVLYKEDEYYGLGIFKSFTKTAFGNLRLVESGLRPLDAWNPWRCRKNESWAIEKYAYALKVAVLGYIEARGGDQQLPVGIKSGMEQLIDTVLTHVILIEKLSEEETYPSLAYDNIELVERGICNILEVLANNEKDIPDIKVDFNNYDVHEDPTIYGIIAETVFEYFEKISSINKHERHSRSLTISLWMNIYTPIMKDSKAIKEIQKRLEILLLNQVDENLQHLCCPAITKLLIIISGLNEENMYEGFPDKNRFMQEFYSRLKKHFKKAWQTDSKRAKWMIPSTVKYDDNKNQLIEEREDGTITILSVEHD